MDAPIRATLMAALLQSSRRPAAWALTVIGFSLGPLLWTLRNAGAIGLQDGESIGWALELAQLGAWAGACAGLVWTQTHRAWLELWHSIPRWLAEWSVICGAAVLSSAVTSSFILSQTPYPSSLDAFAAIGACLLLGFHAGSLATTLLRLPWAGPWRIPAFLALSLGAATIKTDSSAAQGLLDLVRPQPTLEASALLATALAALAWGLLSGALTGLPRRR